MKDNKPYMAQLTLAHSHIQTLSNDNKSLHKNHKCDKYYNYMQRVIFVGDATQLNVSYSKLSYTKNSDVRPRVHKKERVYRTKHDLTSESNVTFC